MCHPWFPTRKASKLTLCSILGARYEKICRMLHTLFWLFKCSINQRWQNKIKSTPILKLAMVKNSINKFVIKIRPIFRLICQKHDLIFNRLGTYVYLSLYTLMKDLVFYKYFSHRSVLLGSHGCCCIEFGCLQLVLGLGFANLNLCRIIRCEY